MKLKIQKKEKTKSVVMSFRFKPETVELLKKIAKENEVNEREVIEYLIHEKLS